jgi:hypothetical protein
VNTSSMSSPFFSFSRPFRFSSAFFDATDCFFLKKNKIFLFLHIEVNVFLNNDLTELRINRASIRFLSQFFSSLLKLIYIQKFKLNS